MNWNEESVAKLNELISLKHIELRLSKAKKPGGDRKNISALWNRHLEGYGVKLITGEIPQSYWKKVAGRITKAFRQSGKPSIANGLSEAMHRRDILHRSGSPPPQDVLIQVIELVNLESSGCLVVPNPDRVGQYIMIPKDIAEKILVFGMM